MFGKGKPLVICKSQGELDLRQIAASGQCFRLKEYNKDKFIAVTGSHELLWCFASRYKRLLVITYYD